MICLVQSICNIKLYHPTYNPSTGDTSMENVSTGVLQKSKEHYLRSKDKAEKGYDVSRHMQLQMSKYKTNENILSIMSNLQPNYCLKVDFQKVDQHAGGKWLIHDTKRHKDNQLQSLKFPCRLSKLSCEMWHKGVRWHHVESDILKESQGAKTSWEVRDCKMPNT